MITILVHTKSRSNNIIKDYPFHFNGTKDEFIDKVVNSKYLDDPFGTMRLNNGYDTPHNLDTDYKNFIDGSKLKKEFVEYLKDKFKVAKSNLTNSSYDNGCGIFILDENIPNINF